MKLPNFFCANSLVLLSASVFSLDHNSSSEYEKFVAARLRLYAERDESSQKSRSLASNVHHSRHVNKPWMSLASVDGLRNDEVAMFVTSTAFKDAYFLRARFLFQ